jgi:hypothetical protein
LIESKLETWLIPWLNWNLERSVFKVGGILENKEKIPQRTMQQQTQPSCDSLSQNQPWALATSLIMGSMGGVVVRALTSHHCDPGSKFQLDSVEEEPFCGTTVNSYLFYFLFTNPV